MKPSYLSVSFEAGNGFSAGADLPTGVGVASDPLDVAGLTLLPPSAAGATVAGIMGCGMSEDDVFWAE